MYASFLLVDCEGSVAAMVEYASRPGRYTMPDRYYTTEHWLAQGGSSDDSLLRVVHLDACLLVCGRQGNYRCEPSMRQNFDEDDKVDTQVRAHLTWIDQELTKPACWRVVVGHWPLYSFFGNGA